MSRGEYMFLGDRDVDDAGLHDPIARENGGYHDFNDDPADDLFTRVEAVHPDVVAAPFDDYGVEAENLIVRRSPNN